MAEIRTAIVTGYSSGLGRTFATGLLDAGWAVVGVARGQAPSDLVEKYGGTLKVVRGSVDRDETVRESFAAATSMGPLRLVVNCAGQGVFGEVGTYSAEDVQKVLAGNLSGLILFSDASARVMADHGGTIVNVMSTAAKKLRATESIYCAAKWGAKGYTRTLRDALKAKKVPIKVIEVYPCGMKTDFWADAVRPASDGSNFPTPDAIAEPVLRELEADREAYCQEFTFERS